MNIAILSFYGGLNDRGVESYVYELATRLTDLGHQVIVYQNGKSRMKTNYRVEYLPSIFLLPPFVQEPDIIMPTNGRLQAVLTRIWTLLHRKKYIAVGHSGLGADDKLNLFTFPDVFVGLTEFQCKWAGRVNSLVRNVRISNGVDLARFSPQTPPFHFGLKGSVILSVAALEPIKRLDLLIKAVAKTDYSLALVGRGSLKDTLEEMGHKLLGPGRFGIYSPEQKDIPSVYTGSSVFAYPTSPFESFGIVMLEAMASNLPVVATNDPIRQEILGEAGIVADPIDTDKFAAALKAAVSRSWGDLPRKRAEQFGWDEAAQRYNSLILKLYEPQD